MREGDAEVASTDATPVGSRFVRALLSRHGVPPMRHITLVAELLGFRYTVVQRRMKGEVAWELEEIEKVAAHFGETLATVFSAVGHDEYLSAVLVAGESRVQCRLQLGDLVRSLDPNRLVALQVGSQWLVCPAAQAGVGPTRSVS